MFIFLSISISFSNVLWLFLGTSGCQGSDEQVERDSSGAEWKQHGCVRAEAKRPLEKQQDLQYCLCRALARSGKQRFLWQNLGQDPYLRAVLLRGGDGQGGGDGHRCPIEGMG